MQPNIKTDKSLCGENHGLADTVIPVNQPYDYRIFYIR
jgi:hypothetical protein